MRNLLKKYEEIICKVDKLVLDSDIIEDCREHIIQKIEVTYQNIQV